LGGRSGEEFLAGVDEIRGVVERLLGGLCVNLDEGFVVALLSLFVGLAQELEISRGDPARFDGELKGSGTFFWAPFFLARGKRESGGQRTDGGGQRTDDGGRKTEDRAALGP